MVAVHAKENVGCMKCHGASRAHRNDEDNVTAPDKMFAPPGSTMPAANAMKTTMPPRGR